MRKILYSVLLSAVALFVFVPGVNAQTEDWSIEGVFKSMGYTGAPEFKASTPKVDEDNSVSLDKTISKPINGTYWLKLEAFATGSGIQTTVTKPSDIVLVLDLSSSMRREYLASTTEWYEYDQAFFYNYFSDAPTYYYKDDNGSYHQVSRSQANNRYRLSFTSGGTTYYLAGTEVTTTPPTDGPTADDGIIWTGKLYSHSQTRLYALKDAVSGFVDAIYANAEETKAKDASFTGHRLAIVTYSGDSRTSCSDQHVEKQIYNVTSGFKDVQTNKDALLEIVDELDLLDERLEENSGTRPELGLKMVIDEILPSKRAEADLSVTLFTDGYPVQDQSWDGQGTGSSRFVYRIANDAIYYASLLKEAGAKIFTVGLITAENTDNYRRVCYLMDVMSSNYPDATWGDSYTEGSNNAWTVSGTTVSVSGLDTGEKFTPPADNPDFSYFQLVDGDTDLSSIFSSIAEMSGSSGEESLTQETETIDVISSSFVLPEGTKASDILVFTARYDFNEGDPTFVTEILAGHSPDTFADYIIDNDGKKVLDDPAKLVDEDIEPDVTGNTITIEGFDYSDNWVGEVKENNVLVDAHGHKLIILIPIQMSEDAVGGPNVKTNAPGSGIKKPDGTLITFPEPDVSLPVNIHIETVGLKEGESAKYTILRSAPDDPNDEGFAYVTSVYVTRHEGQGDDAIVKVKGLPSAKKVGDNEYDYVYRIVDENWSWSYDLTEVDGIGPADDDNPEGKPFVITTGFDTDVTTDKFVVNPITFVNEKVQGVNSGIRHAESKATNKFTVITDSGTLPAGSTVGYDDSKKNDKEGRDAQIIKVKTEEEEQEDE